MKKYLIASALVVSFAGPALADKIFVVHEPESGKCGIVSNVPDGVKVLGSYASKDEAVKAMGAMKECG
jgi:hypothetical protein